VRRYALDTRTATPHFPGIGRYVINLARAMASLLRDDERIILLHDPTEPFSRDLQALAGEQVQVVKAPISPFSLRQQWVVPRLLRRLGVDLCHSPYYLMPYRPGVPTVLTVYDLIPLHFPQYVSPQARLLFRWATGLALRAADRVIAISQHTAQDLRAAYAIGPSRLTVIPLAAAPTFYPRPAPEVSAVRQKYGLPDRYLLYVGSNKPHKNLLRLVEAWAQYAIRNTHCAPHATLVIAGLWDPRYPQPRQRAQALGLDESVIWLGPLPDADLPALYSGAATFVFPSLYEGFGLPVLEAMACGTPVACSNSSSLPEVVGDAARTFDPGDAAAIAAALRDLVSDKTLRTRLRERGLQRAGHFSWTRTARETLDLYRQVEES